MMVSEVAGVRILLLADTHLGFDLPFRPRVERRRRGHDFFANFKRALQPAVKQEIDLVVHGGDLFFRSRVPTALVQMAMAPLVQVADQGVPVFIVPGNHERSRIPLHLWAVHPHIYIFDEPKTFRFSLKNFSISLSGFPFQREIRDIFQKLVDHTGYKEEAADVRVLCIHQTVEGSQVGPSDYTFRSGPDIIRGEDVPEDFAAVLAGHIHRSQMLTHNLAGKPMAAPVIYPGSIERTSFAERKEDKHVVILKIDKGDEGRGQLKDVSFIPLPTRPMITLDVDTKELSGSSFTRNLQHRLWQLDPEAIVRIKLRGDVSSEIRSALSAPKLRSLAPPSMNVSLSYDSRSKLAER